MQSHADHAATTQAFNKVNDEMAKMALDDLPQDNVSRTAPPGARVHPCILQRFPGAGVCRITQPHGLRADAPPARRLARTRTALQ